MTVRAQVWLASERTLLSWFRVSLLLSSFALALFNSAGPRDYASKSMGVCYAVIACGMLAYAWVMHRIRRYRIVMRYPGHHDEPYGPVVVCGLIFVAVLVNFVLRVRHRYVPRRSLSLALLVRPPRTGSTDTASPARTQRGPARHAVAQEPVGDDHGARPGRAQPPGAVVAPLDRLPACS